MQTQYKDVPAHRRFPKPSETFVVWNDGCDEIVYFCIHGKPAGKGKFKAVELETGLELDTHGITASMCVIVGPVGDVAIFVPLK